MVSAVVLGKAYAKRSKIDHEIIVVTVPSEKSNIVKCLRIDYLPAFAVMLTDGGLKSSYKTARNTNMLMAGRSHQQQSGRHHRLLPHQRPSTLL